MSAAEPAPPFLGNEGDSIWSGLSNSLRQPFARSLLLITAAGLALRLAAVWIVPTQPVSDFWAYYQQALAFYRTVHHQVVGGVPDAMHPPAYPVLLGLAFLVTGGIHTLAVAKLVNCALGGATILIGSLTARTLWGDRAGLFAAFLSAFYPRYVLTVCVLASESLFAPLLLGFVLLSIVASRSRFSPRGAVLGGVLVGLLALTRTVAYFLALVWLLGAVVTGKRVRPIVLELVLLVALQHAIMLPWAIRNQLAVGRFTFLTTSGGMGLFNGNNPNATGLWYDWGKDLERVSPGITKKNAVEIDDAARKAAIAWMRQHPGKAAKLYFEKLRFIAIEDVDIGGWALFGQRISPPVPGIDVLPWPNPLKEHPRAVTLVLRAAAAGVVLLGALGFLLLFLRALCSRAPADWSIALTFLATAAYVPLVSALIAVNGRYRWPTEDLLIPVAASLLAPRRPAP